MFEEQGGSVILRPQTLHNMHKHSLTIPKTARIFSEGQLDTASNILIALHGYGQLADAFVREFECLYAQADWAVVAPEGLSRFYLKGYYGRVGASWMTKEDRETEIADQAIYLDEVAAFIRQQNPAAKLNLLGFSQGAATAWRWVLNGHTEIASFCCWAGQCPEEYNDRLLRQLNTAPFYHVNSTEDEFIPLDAARLQAEHLGTHFPDLQAFEFEGRHQLNPDLLAKLYLA